MIEGVKVLNYDGEIRAPIADLISLKILLNSVITNPNAKHMTVDIKNFYLATKLETKQHMFVQEN